MVLRSTDLGGMTSGLGSMARIFGNPQGLQTASVSDLLRIWSALSSGDRLDGARAYAVLGERLLHAGEPFVAYDVVSRGLERWPKHSRLRQLLGLALARSGACESANQILSALYAEGKRDGETLGILARTHKDMATLASTVSARRQQHQLALSLYMEGYRRATRNRKRTRLDDALYNGINAASISLLCGQSLAAESLAREVQEICRRKLKKKRDDYWALATLGESALILGDMEEAEAYYGLAGEAGKGNYGILSTTRRQARLVLENLGLDRDRFDHCFPIPGVAVFLCPTCWEPLSQASVEAMDDLRKAVAKRLREINAGFGYSSAACGPELLFMEEMLRQQGEVHIVLPFEKDAFLKTCVDGPRGTDWGRRFNRVSARAARLLVACEQCTRPSAMAVDFAGLLLLGLAELHARMLDVPLTPLVVQHGISQGEDSVEPWAVTGLRPEVIDLREERCGLSAFTFANHHADRHDPQAPAEAVQSIKAMLFADVVGYSRMAEENIPAFVKRFLGLISRLIENAEKSPLTGNTWGDAFHFVFEDVEHAAGFALELRDRVVATPWRKFGLPEHLNLRISLHAGPVFHCEDPILKRLKYTGSHVSRAARIEPITPPGQIYASQEFAALAAATQARRFRCDYAGKIPLPKQSGTIPLYLIRRNMDRIEETQRV